MQKLHKKTKHQKMYKKHQTNKKQRMSIASSCQYWASLWILQIYLISTMNYKTNNTKDIFKTNNKQKTTQDTNTENKVLLQYNIFKVLIFWYVHNLYLHIILQQCNDIETNPGPNTITNKDIFNIVKGTTHQGSKTYENISKQASSSCMTNSLISIAYTIINSLNTNDINEILQLEIQLYKEIYPNQITKDHSAYLAINDLQTNCTINSMQFTSNINQLHCGYLQ